MANLCKFKIIVKGRKNACAAFYASTVSNGGLSVMEEHGTVDNYYLRFEGGCNWSVDYRSKKWDGPCPVELPEDIQEAGVKAKQAYSDYSLQDRSRMFRVEVLCNSGDVDDFDCARYVHYRSGIPARSYCPDELRLKEERYWRPAAEVEREEQERFASRLTPMTFLNFRGKQFAATGYTDSEVRKFRAEVEQRGGTLTNSVRDTTYCLIVNPDSNQPTNKFETSCWYPTCRITGDTFWYLASLEPVTKENCDHQDVTIVEDILQDVPENVVHLDLSQVVLRGFSTYAFYGCTKLRELIMPKEMIPPRQYIGCVTEKTNMHYQAEANLTQCPLERVEYAVPYQFRRKFFPENPLPEFYMPLDRLSYYETKDSKWLASLVFARDYEKYTDQPFMAEEYGKYIKRNKAEWFAGDYYEHMGRFLLEMGLLNQEDLDALRQRAEECGNTEFSQFLANAVLTKPKKSKAAGKATPEEKLWHTSGECVIKYRGLETDITVPETIKGFPITAVGDLAFSPNASGLKEPMRQARRELRRVVLPKGVTFVALDAFDGCEKLEEVIFPEDYRFGALTCVSLMKMGNVRVPARCFANERAYLEYPYEEVTVPEGVEQLGKYVFYKGQMEHATLPEGLRIIKDYAFAFCDKLESINIPESVEQIGFAAFWLCDSLKSIRIPAKTVILEEQEEASIEGWRKEKEMPGYFRNFKHRDGTHVTIYTPKGSPAAAFAKKFGIPLVEE